ncbi:hypothetical protein [Parapedomonas caeni]|jgi:hypothetical protein
MIAAPRWILCRANRRLAGFYGAIDARCQPVADPACGTACVL